jgi:hypothetical protein
MLPGKAKLNVCVLPFVGLKTAEGRDVSTASDGALLSPPFSLRFCELSARFSFSLFHQMYRPLSYAVAPLYLQEQFNVRSSRSSMRFLVSGEEIAISAL